MHDILDMTDPTERVEVVGGWIGRAWNPGAQVWTVHWTVYEDRHGLRVSEHWWAMRYEMHFGVIKSRVYGFDFDGSVVRAP